MGGTGLPRLCDKNLPDVRDFGVTIVTTIIIITVKVGGLCFCPGAKPLAV